MFPFVPALVSTKLVTDLDTQLTRRNCCTCHVMAGPDLVGIGWYVGAPPTRDHSELDSYLQADLITQHVNALQVTSDAERIQTLIVLMGAV
jgi:hypothetical protein